MELYRRYRPAGTSFLGVSLDDDLGKLDAMVTAKQIPWPQLSDRLGFAGEVPRAFHVTGTPTLWLIDDAGKLVARSHTVEDLEDDLERLAAR